MPTYDYVCRACEHRFEHFQSMQEAGQNWVRVWMTDFYITAIEWNATHFSHQYDGVGQYAREPQLNEPDRVGAVLADREFEHPEAERHLAADHANPFVLHSFGILRLRHVRRKLVRVARLLLVAGHLDPEAEGSAHQGQPEHDPE